MKKLYDYFIGKIWKFRCKVKFCGKAFLRDPKLIWFLIWNSRYSYAQIREDLMIDYLTGQKKNGFRVDVGANHRKKLSNTYLFHKKGRTGINIEPHPLLYAELEKHRKNNINLNIGVGKEEGSLDFFSIHSHTLSTFDPVVAKEAKQHGHHIEKVEKVQISPLKNIFNIYINHKQIDFMSVDTEGFDKIVLESNDWEKWRPHYIILESPDCSEYLEKVGYKLVYYNYLNTIRQDSRIQ